MQIVSYYWTKLGLAYVWHKGRIQHASLQASPIQLCGVEKWMRHHILGAHASVAATQALLYRFS